MPPLSMSFLSSPLAVHLLRGALMLLFLFVCFLGVLYLLQDKLILYPTSASDAAPGSAPTRPVWAVPWLDDGEFFGKSYQHGQAVEGTVLVYHGNAGTIEHRAALARVVAEQRFRVVLVEYPGFGERGGHASVASALDGSLDAFRRARRKWDGPMYVMGESLGAGIAAQVAGRYPDDVAGVLLFTPWDSLYKLANAKMRGVPLGVILRRRLDSSAALASYPGNVVIAAAQYDELIPTSHARALADALPGALYIEIPGAEHNTWLHSLSDSDWARLLAGMSAPKPAISRVP